MNDELYDEDGEPIDIDRVMGVTELDDGTLKLDNAGDDGLRYVPPSDAPAFWAAWDAMR